MSKKLPVKVEFCGAVLELVLGPQLSPIKGVVAKDGKRREMIQKELAA